MLCIGFAFLWAGNLVADTGKGTPDPAVRGIGINYFSAFSRVLADEKDTSYLAGLDVLAAKKIPFIRFIGCGFWPTDWALYQKDKEEYFRRLDAFFKAAEERHIGLIPSLFWCDTTVPALMDEPRGAWGDPNSKTIAFMRTYVSEVVGRYKNSPALWMWEFGNEYSLAADLPNAADCRPKKIPHLGLQREGSPEDDMTTDRIISMCREFGEAVRKIDPVHPITTGNSMPRPCAQHFRRAPEYTADSREEFMQNLIEVTPDPVDTISVHLYVFDKEGRFGQKITPYKELLDLCVKASERSGKGLFVGEFGAAEGADLSADQAKIEARAILDALVASRTPLAALWVFDLPIQEDSINVSTTNHRAWLLDAVGEANRRLQEALAAPASK